MVECVLLFNLHYYFVTGALKAEPMQVSITCKLGTNERFVFVFFFLFTEPFQC